MTALWLAMILYVSPTVQGYRDWQAQNLRAGLSAHGWPAIRTYNLLRDDAGVWDRRIISSLDQLSQPIDKP